MGVVGACVRYATQGVDALEYKLDDAVGLINTAHTGVGGRTKIGYVVPVAIT